MLVRDLQEQLHPYIGGIITNLKGTPLRINGIRDHIHIVCGLRPNISVATAVQTIKASSSLWIHETFPLMSTFAWQEGYGAFAVSRSNVDAVVQYVAEQQRHHETMTFQQEYLAMLKKNGVDYDPQYVWG